MSKQIPSFETQDIDHLGIVAGIVDEIGIVERIDTLVGTHPLEKVSACRASSESNDSQLSRIFNSTIIFVSSIFCRKSNRASHRCRSITRTSER